MYSMNELTVERVELYNPLHTEADNKGRVAEWITRDPQGYVVGVAPTLGHSMAQAALARHSNRYKE